MMEVAIGRIDFQNPQGLSKPGNLQNSAVLRMLEEEDSRQRNGQYTGTKRVVAWPPARDGSEEYVEQSAVQSQVAGQNSSQVPAQQYNPVQHHQAHQQQAPQSPQYYQPPAKTVEPPPSIITLRPEAPVNQAPAPVYTSQPATATLKGGKNLRGDMKWPPEIVRERMSAEEAGRIALAQGPACRPRRIAKDYSGFFAQHTLNSTYPGYKTPPGTQFYEHQPMM